MSALAELINMLRSDICKIETTAYALVPEWWQVRRGGDIPQLVVGYRKDRSYYALTIPHFMEQKRLHLEKTNR